MEEAKRISAHIAESHDPAALTLLLDALDGQTLRDHQIIVVEDRSRTTLEGEQREALIRLRNFRDQGFARAHNQAIAFALSRWPSDALDDRFIAFLDPHVVPAPDAFEHLLRALIADPSLTAVGPKVYTATRTWSDVDECAMLESTDVLDNAGFVMPRTRRPRFVGAGERSTDGAESITEVFGIPEGCLIVRASALRDIAWNTDEVLDPDLRRGQELWDVCWRLQWHGANIRCVGSARAYRHGRGGADRKEQRRALAERNQMESKNDTLLARLPHLPWTAWDALRFWVGSFVDPGLMIARVTTWMPQKRRSERRRHLLQQRRLTSSEMRKKFV